MQDVLDVKNQGWSEWENAMKIIYKCISEIWQIVSLTGDISAGKLLPKYEDSIQFHEFTDLPITQVHILDSSRV
jgi:hypothetical protein